MTQQVVTIDGIRQYDAVTLLRYFGSVGETPSKRLAEMQAERAAAWRSRATFEELMTTFKEKTDDAAH